MVRIMGAWAFGLSLLLFAPPGTARGDSASAQIARDVGFAPRIGERISGRIELTDERGETRLLSEYFDGAKPVVLTLNYFSCTTLCPLILDGMTAFDRSDFEIGNQFTLLTVSIDPRDTPGTAAPLKAREVARYGRPEAAAGWHFLTGDKGSIEQLTQAVGFRYVYDQQSNQFAHPAGIVVLAPDGTIARYLYGIDFAPSDLRLALTEASNGRVGTPFDQLALLCYHYDPATGRYSSMAMMGVRLGGLATVLALGWFLWSMWRRDLEAARESRQPNLPGGDTP
jgi:protein SCO1/2